MARDLVGRDLAFAPGCEIVACRRSALAELDPRHDLFAVLLRRDADDLDVGDVGVGVEELLDLSGINVFAAPDDHVLDPADDVDVAVVAHDGEVTGVHPPSIVDRLAGRLFVVPVPAHDKVAAAAELATSSPRYDSSRGRVDDLDLDVGVDATDG